MIQQLRFSPEQFEKMLGSGIISPDDRVELLEGCIVQKMTQYPPHASCCDCVQGVLRLRLPKGWSLREQKPIRTKDSMPEPDHAIVRGDFHDYARRHPEPADIGMLIEVSDTTLETDRGAKLRIYARARIPIYWIINLIDEQIEVYTQPKGGKSPAYRDSKIYSRSESIPFALENEIVRKIPVSDLLPIVRPQVLHR